MRKGLHVDERRAGDHEGAEHEEDDWHGDARRAEERVEPVGDRRADDAAVPLEPGDDGEEEAGAEQAEPEEVVVRVRACWRRARFFLRTRAGRLRANPRRTLLRRHAQPCFAARAAAPPRRPATSEPTRSQRSSRNASASMSTPTSAFGSSPVRCQRSTTVRPAAELRLAVDVDMAVQRLHDPGPEHLRDRHRVVDRRPVGTVRAPVVLDEEVVQLGDERGRSGPTRAGGSACASVISALWVTSRPIIVTGRPLRKTRQAASGST